MKFSGKKQFKEAIVDYGLRKRKEIKFIKDEGDRVRAKCTWPTCKWVCLARKTSKFESWQITSFIDEHTCPKRRDNKLVTCTRIANKFENLIKSNTDWSVQNLKATVQEEMFANVHISKIKRAKAIVSKRIQESKLGEYSQVFDYQLELLRSNPGSTCIVKLNPDNEVPTFDKFYICFDACKKGFLAGCRKVIGLDGCFLKGRGGEVLSAIGRDANHQMYLIAWALVDKETNETWDWFVSLLCSDLKLGDGSDYVIISDQQKGILKAVENWLPRAEHRNCARHLYANWRKTYREKEWQKLFWACAKASSPMLFNLARAKLAQETVEGARDVMKTDPHHWSRAWFRLGSNCDSVDSNICESFNKWIVEPRCLPAISMFEAIRVKIMARIEYQRTESDKWTGTICPTVLRKLKKSINASAYCHAVWNGEDLYEVTHREHRFQVNLEEWTCSCRYWQLSGLPCPHAISCIFFKTNNIDDYIDKCYSIEAFKKTYAFCLQPVEGRPAWPVSERPRPNPPGEIMMPGRKKKQRTREQQEKPRCATRVSKRGTKIRCSMCKLHGHNRTSCKARNGTGSSNIPTPE
uniref:SWIM-type domain-containing protein n=1 Tax=Triticum urartu TaxID=4572 RepID=A0A8R7V023_TRIUA